MPKPTKPRMGRPKLPKGDAKGRIVSVRFNPNDLKRIELAARASQKTITEWIRGTVTAAMEAQQGNAVQIRTLPTDGRTARQDAD